MVRAVATSHNVAIPQRSHGAGRWAHGALSPTARAVAPRLRVTAMRARCAGVARLVDNPHNPRTRRTANRRPSHRGGGSGVARRAPGESRCGHFPAAGDQRLDARQRLRRGRARLHDGLRHHPAHQLRARRGRDDRRDGVVLRDHPARRRASWACRRSRSWSPACWWRSPSAWASATRWSASPTGRCARRRGSPRSSPRSACRSSSSTSR